MQAIAVSSRIREGTYIHDVSFIVVRRAINIMPTKNAMHLYYSKSFSIRRGRMLNLYMISVLIGAVPFFKHRKGRLAVSR